MSRLGAQLPAVLDQLAALGGQLAAAGDPEAAEAQAEAVRAEAAAQVGQARAETASQAVARHAAELDVAEARAAAAQAITAMEAEAAARQHAEELARDAGRALDDERRAAAARIAEAEQAVTVACGERDAALAAAEVGGSLRALVADPDGTAEMEAGEEPFGALEQSLAVQLGIRSASAPSEGAAEEILRNASPRWYRRGTDAQRGTWDAVVDVSNVCWSPHLPPVGQRTPVWHRLALVMGAWRELHGESARFYLIADDSLVRVLDDVRELQHLRASGDLVTRPVSMHSSSSWLLITICTSSPATTLSTNASSIPGSTGHRSDSTAGRPKTARCGSSRSASRRAAHLIPNNPWR